MKEIKELHEITTDIKVNSFDYNKIACFGVDDVVCRIDLTKCPDFEVGEKLTLLFDNGCTGYEVEGICKLINAIQVFEFKKRDIVYKKREEIDAIIKNIKEE